MQLSPTQIAIISVSFAAAFILALIWYGRDLSEEVKEEHKESFSILMSVFFWAVVFSFVLKMFIDLVQHYYPEQIFYTTWFFILTLFLEEMVKIGALLMGIELAGKYFNELSDGVIYTVFAALGFIFLENILYLVPEASNTASFLRVLAGRNIFTFAMHLFTTIFGVFYAFAYLHSHHMKHGHRVKPEQIGKQIKILWQEFGVKLIPWIPFAPFVTLYKFLSGSKGFKNITIPEILWSGFLLSSYLHIGYDLLLGLEIPVLNALAFFIVLIFLAGMYLFFQRLDVNIRSNGLS